MKKRFIKKMPVLVLVMLFSASLFAKDEEYYTLFNSLSEGDIAGFKSSFEKSYNPRTKKYSININKQIDMGDGVKITFLTHAAGKGDLDFVKYLVDRGADVNLNTGAKNGDLTPLINAARSDNISIMEFFFAKKAKVDGTDNKKTTPLMHALESGKYAAAKYLIEKKANVKAVNMYGVTTLMFAVTSGNIECIKLVLNCKVDVNKKNKNGETALLLADQRNSNEIMELLIAAGAKDDRVEYKKQEIPKDEKNPVGKWKKTLKARGVILYMFLTLKPDNTGIVEFSDPSKAKGTLKWHMKGDILVIEDIDAEGYPLAKEEQKNYTWQDGKYVSAKTNRDYYILERIE